MDSSTRSSDPTKTSIFDGAGNTFACFDNRALTFDGPIHRICLDNQVDGVILVENSTHAQFRMRLYNPDGSEANMCGNGLRCMKAYLRELGHQDEFYTIETGAGILTVADQEDLVVAEMPLPRILGWDLPIEIAKQLLRVDWIDAGVPHAVIFFDQIGKLPVDELGEKIHRHPHFGPQKTNVTFVEIQKNDQIAIRTFERGVERETGACGTGACAAAIATSRKTKSTGPITIHPTSGIRLEVHLLFDEGRVIEIALRGPAGRR